MKAKKVLLISCLILFLGGCSKHQTTSSSSSFSSSDVSISSTSSIEYIDEAMVHYVESLIEELPSPSTNNEVVKQIFTAKDFYDSLAELDKTHVYNFTKLNNYVSAIYDYVKPDLAYTSEYEVALYIFLYDDLPSNYITKNEATDLGWNGSGSSLWNVCPNKSIGGDQFFNREGLLPANTTYYECDIDYNGRSRGSKRIVYSLIKDTIYYTQDHYESFEQLY